MDQHCPRIVLTYSSKMWLRLSGTLRSVEWWLVQTFQDNLSFPSRRLTNCLSSLTSLSLKMGLLGCPETSAQYYHSTLRIIPAECRYYLNRGGNLKSCTAKWEIAEMTVGRGGKINFPVSVEMYTWFIQNITKIESHWL